MSKKHLFNKTYSSDLSFLIKERGTLDLNKPRDILDKVTYKKNAPTFIDLFSGVGGFRIPLEKLGGKCIAYSEIDKHAIEVYRQNFKTTDET